MGCKINVILICSCVQWVSKHKVWQFYLLQQFEDHVSIPLNTNEKFIKSCSFDGEIYKSPELLTLVDIWHFHCSMRKHALKNSSQSFRKGNNGIVLMQFYKYLLSLIGTILTSTHISEVALKIFLEWFHRID